MTAFNLCGAKKKLDDLSRMPIDLTRNGVLTPARISRFSLTSSPFSYSYAGELVTEEVLLALFDLAKECGAVEKMRAMQEGEKINVSEKRAVLHTCVRSFYKKSLTDESVVNERRLAKDELEKLKVFLEEIDAKKRFDCVVQIGIGGSDLGPRALYRALRYYGKPGRTARFVANVDPDDAASVLKDIDLKKTLVVVVSKSGSTLETRTNEELFRQAFIDAGIDPKDHFVAVTGLGSPMDDPGRYLQSFYIWDYVGGRFSSTSMAGVVMLGFILGFDKLEQLLSGANQMDIAALEPDPSKNLPLLAALFSVWNRNFLRLPTTVIVPYSEALSSFVAHLQQCSMESNGKSVDIRGHFVNYATGPVIWGEPGTNGQHSFFQLLHQGTDVVPVEFIGFAKSQYGVDKIVDGTTSEEKLLANLFAQSLAFSLGQKDVDPNKCFRGNRPCSILLSERLDPYVMGALLAYYEHKIAFEGFIWDINSFDQEGVQLGKMLAGRVLKLFAEHRRGKKGGDFALGVALMNLMENITGTLLN